MRKYFIWIRPTDSNYSYLGLYATERTKFIDTLKIYYPEADILPQDILEFDNLDDCANYAKVLRRLKNEA